MAPVERRRLWEQVAEQLEAQIAGGALAPGDALPPEKDLTARFGVSRPTVREALLSLQQKGLVEIRNGERARVTEPTLSRMIASLSGAARLYLGDQAGIRHFQMLRRVLEIAIAREVAATRSPADLDRLRQALAANHAALDDPAAFAATDIAFHAALVDAAGNPLLTGLNQALAGWLAEQRRVSLAHPGVAATAYAGHAAILEAIAGSDREAAATAMDLHLKAIESFFRDP